MFLYVPCKLLPTNTSLKFTLIQLNTCCAFSLLQPYLHVFFLAPGRLPITSYGDPFCPESPPLADASSTDTWTSLGLVWSLNKNNWISFVVVSVESNINVHSQVTTGTTSLIPRWDKCVNYVENTIIYATGRIFVDKHFQEDKKHMVRHLFVYLLTYLDMFISLFMLCFQSFFQPPIGSHSDFVSI